MPSRATRHQVSVSCDVGDSATCFAVKRPRRPAGTGRLYRLSSLEATDDFAGRRESTSLMLVQKERAHAAGISDVRVYPGKGRSSSEAVLRGQAGFHAQG